MLQFCMNWTPVTSIRTHAAHPSTIRVPATSGVCGSRPGREHRESTDLSRSYRVGSYLVGEDSSPESVRLFSRRKIPLCPFSSNFAHRFRKRRKDRGDTGVQSRMRKWAYSAQFLCNISPFRMNTCKSVSKQRTSTSFRMNTYEKTPGGQAGTILCLEVHSPHPIFRTLSQVPYPVSSLLATLTKTPGVWGYSSYSGTHPINFLPSYLLISLLRYLLLPPLAGGALSGVN